MTNEDYKVIKEEATKVLDDFLKEPRDMQIRRMIVAMNDNTGLLYIINAQSKECSAMDKLEKDKVERINDYFADPVHRAVASIATVTAELLKEFEKEDKTKDDKNV